MDIGAGSAYLSGMLGRLITLLAIVAIAVVTAAAAAHAPRISAGTDHASHAGAMIHTSAGSEPSCEDGRHCGSPDAGLCEFLCAGLSAFLASPGAEAGPGHGPASHDLPSPASHAGHPPALDERPPRPRLL